MATASPRATEAKRRFVEKLLDSYHLDISIVGVCSFDVEGGATTRSHYEVPTKQAFIAAAAETLIPVEVSKLGTIAPFRVADPIEASIVVLEDSIDALTSQQLQSAGVTVISV